MVNLFDSLTFLPDGFWKFKYGPNSQNKTWHPERESPADDFFYPKMVIYASYIKISGEEMIQILMKTNIDKHFDIIKKGNGLRCRFFKTKETI